MFPTKTAKKYIQKIKPKQIINIRKWVFVSICYKRNVVDQIGGYNFPKDRMWIAFLHSYKIKNLFKIILLKIKYFKSLYMSLQIYNLYLMNLSLQNRIGEEVLLKAQPSQDLILDQIQKDNNKSSIQSFIEGKWSTEQNLKFVVFITINKQIFKSKEKRKAERIFKDLSNFVQTRTPRQCRSHFQKMNKKFKTLVKMKRFYRQLVGEKQFDLRIFEAGKENQSSSNQNRSRDGNQFSNVQTQTDCSLSFNWFKNDIVQNMTNFQPFIWYYPIAM